MVLIWQPKYSCHNGAEGLTEERRGGGSGEKRGGGDKGVIVYLDLLILVCTSLYG